MTAQRAETVLHCAADVTDTGSLSLSLSSLRQFCFDLCLPAARGPLSTIELEANLREV